MNAPAHEYPEDELAMLLEQCGELSDDEKLFAQRRMPVLMESEYGN